MPLFWLTALAMLAFAANSVLTRAAVAGGLIDPMAFALWRVLAGACMLGALVAWRGGGRWAAVRRITPARVAGVAGLSVYLTGFSLAYAGLEAGAGALILFGVVQITMFAGAVTAAEPVPPRRWAGAAVAFGGLVVLLAPGGDGGAVSPGHAVLMALAGVGWGGYSLAARGQSDALAATAANFLGAVPVVALAWLLAGGGASAEIGASAGGVALAVLSGAVTSGLGYALWYRLVPRLGAARAGVAQLSVPVIAAAGGLALAEPLGWRFALATALVLGGIALASTQRSLTSR